MNLISGFVVVFFLFSASGCQQETGFADVVIMGGKIYTVNSQQPMVEAVAVKDDKILFAGSQKEVRKYIRDSTKIIDLEGKMMTPGFIEGHGHIMAIGYNALELDLSTAKNFDEIVESVKDAVSKSKPGQWILGRGWHQDKWDRKPPKMVKGFQTHDLLSKVSPDNPVYLEHASGHAALANAKAMEMSGVNLLSAEKMQRDLSREGGEIFRDAL
jgi:predicted amidohydrolase YtcJ